MGRALSWPWPALLAWALSIGLWRWTDQAWTLAAGALMVVGPWGHHLGGPWRRIMVAAGGPLAAILLDRTALSGSPYWAWAALILWCLYPARHWREAPWFPTRSGALQGLNQALPLPQGARVLDAGCGMGHGLRALASQYPRAHLVGADWHPIWLTLGRWIWPWWSPAEWSGNIQWLRGDLWTLPWQDYDLVYVFLRPEVMPKVWQKWQAEARPGTWLLSLCFECPGATPARKLEPVKGLPIWVYRR